MGTIIILWLVFALLFLGLAIFHFIQAGKKMPEFKLSKRPGESQRVTLKVLGAGIDQPAKDLSDSFNAHIEELNNSNKRINIIQGVGYVVAFLVALFSMYLTIVGK